MGPVTVRAQANALPPHQIALQGHRHIQIGKQPGIQRQLSAARGHSRQDDLVSLKLRRATVGIPVGRLCFVARNKRQGIVARIVADAHVHLAFLYIEADYLKPRLGFFHRKWQPDVTKTDNAEGSRFVLDLLF